MRTVWAGWALSAASFFSFFVVMPALAPALAALGAPPELVGLGVGLYSAGNLLGNVLGGVILDRQGLRAPTAVGLLATALALLGQSLTSSLAVFVALRFLHGLFSGVLLPGAFVHLAAGRTRAAFNLAVGWVALLAVAAPPLGGVLLDRGGWPLVFRAGSGALLAALPAALGRPPNPHRREDRFPALRPLLPAYASVLGLSLALGTALAFVPGLVGRLGGGGQATGLSFAFFSLGALGGMAAEVGRRRGRGPELWGCGAAGAALLALGFAPSVAGVWASLAALGLGFGLVLPWAARAVAERTPPFGRGRAYGLFYAAFSLGAFLGPALGGLLARLDARGPFLLAGAILWSLLPWALAGRGGSGAGEGLGVKGA
ncbi:MAG: MFS transporter [Candidatus Bipolaricaulaceae bacterium]